MTGPHRYRAVGPTGRTCRGTIVAASARDAEQLLASRGLLPLSVRAIPVSSSRRAASADLAIMFRSMAVLRAADVPLDRVVQITIPLTARHLRPLLEGASERLASGASLSSAMAPHGGIPPVVLGILRAGEASGHATAALDAAAEYLERDAERLARLRQALAYPLVLLAMGTAGVAVIVGVVVPRFALLLGDLGQDLPPATRFLMNASGFAARWWWLGVAALLGSFVVLRRAAANPDGRLILDRARLRAPLVGAIHLDLASARILQGLATSLAAGVPIMSAMASSGPAAANAELERRINLVRGDIASGVPLSTALRAHGAVPETAVPLIEVGEKGGALPEMLRRAAAILGMRAERQVATGLRLVEPALVVAFGGVIAFVAGALLQALYSLRPS